MPKALPRMFQPLCVCMLVFWLDTVFLQLHISHVADKVTPDALLTTKALHNRYSTSGITYTPGTCQGCQCTSLPASCPVDPWCVSHSACLAAAAVLPPAAVVSASSQHKPGLTGALLRMHHLAAKQHSHSTSQHNTAHVQCSFFCICTALNRAQTQARGLKNYTVCPVLRRCQNLCYHG